MNFCLMEPRNAVHEDLYQQLTRLTNRPFQRLPVFQTFDLRLLDKVDLCVHLHHANNQFLDFCTTNWLVAAADGVVVYDPAVLAKFDAVLSELIPPLPLSLPSPLPLPTSTVVDVDDPVEFPAVSVVTLTYNRPQLVPFMKHSFDNLVLHYPGEVEWVVVDDSDVKSEELASPDMAGSGYSWYDTHMTIGKKRNLGVQRATHDWICMMDDDDYYVETSLWQRMHLVLRYQKRGSFCTAIGCYDIMRDTSFVNLPPLQDPIQKRISEASLLFHRNVWEANPFTEKNGEEAATLIDVERMLEVPWSTSLVSVIHNGNTSTRTTPKDLKPNGNLFIPKRSMVHGFMNGFPAFV
jgi:hypothetical protein